MSKQCTAPQSAVHSHCAQEGGLFGPMPTARRFPPPWTLDEHNDACFTAKDATRQALRYFHFEDLPQRR